MSLVYFSNYKIGVIFSFKKFGTVFFSTILHAISVWCGLLKIWCSFFLYSFIGKFYWKWLYIQNLQAHSQNYVNRKLSNLQKAPGRQLVSVLFSTKGGESETKWNEMESMATRNSRTLHWMNWSTWKRCDFSWPHKTKRCDFRWSQKRL